jgi:hypothetical protein
VLRDIEALFDNAVDKGSFTNGEVTDEDHPPMAGGGSRLLSRTWK